MRGPRFRAAQISAYFDYIIM